MEAYLRAGKNNGGIPEPPKTRSHSQDHQERKRRQLQGTKRSLQERLQPHLEGTRVRHQGQTGAWSKRHGCRHVIITWDREEHRRELRTTEDSRPQRGPPGNNPGVTGRYEEAQTKGRSPPTYAQVYRRSRRSGNRPTH